MIEARYSCARQEIMNSDIYRPITKEEQRELDKSRKEYIKLLRKLPNPVGMFLNVILFTELGFLIIVVMLLVLVKLT